MPVVGGSVQVPQGPGLGVELEGDKLERYKVEPAEQPPYLVRMRYGDGLTVYARHEPNRPGSTDSMRFIERLLGSDAPGPSPSYANDVVSDFWDGEDDRGAFERLWREAERGPVWEREKRERTIGF